MFMTGAGFELSHNIGNSSLRI